MAKRDIIVVGGSAGSTEPLKRMLADLPGDFPAALFITSEVQSQRPLRYHCQIGHAYTAEELAAHSGKIDEAIRVALRIMEERAELVERMARDARSTGRWAVAEVYDQRSDEYRPYAQTLREAAILSLNTSREVQDEPS